MQTHQLPSGLHVPRSAAQKRLVLRCNLCMKEFPLAQHSQFVRHVKACDHSNGEEVVGRKVARDEASYLTKSIDPERLQALSEGR